MEFNDPFEFLPSDTELKGKDGIAADFHRQEYRRAMDQARGILCFSHESTVTDPVLWSHYADQHRGIALGFEVQCDSGGQHSFELLSETRGCGAMPIRAVDYTDERVSVDDQIETVDDIHRIIRDKSKSLIFQKGRSWGYEQEWRAVIPLQFADRRSGMFFVPFAPNRLRRVILGWRCGMVDTYFQTLRAQYADVEVLRASPEPKEFRLRWD